MMLLGRDVPIPEHNRGTIAPIALVLHITCVRTIWVQCFGIPFRANCQTQHLCADSELKQVNMEGAGQQVRRAHCESTHAHE